MFLRDSVDEIAFYPDSPFQKKFFDFMMFFKDFTGSDAFYDLGYFGRTVHRY
jgi:hypothetical protein